MFDQMQKMFQSPQTREMMFNMLAQQMAQAPPEKREAMSRVTATVEKLDRGMVVSFGPSDDEGVETMISSSIEGWADMMARMFQSMGFSVEIVE